MTLYQPLDLRVDQGRFKTVPVPVSVDICIPSAKLYIEVNGLQHYTNPKQIITDLKRNHFSDGDDFLTLPVTNQLIDTHLDAIVDAISRVVLRQKE